MLRALVISMRPLQWSKNVFVLAALPFSRRLFETDSLVRGLLAFVVFSLAASAVYLGNDIADRERDRRHPSKSKRPIAAGELPIGVAAAAAALLGAAAVAGALALGARFTLLLIAYLAINALYSSGLKRLVILDVMAISAGFVIRVEAGAAAIAVAVSAWLLLCTIFVSLFLAASKRRHEVELLTEEAASRREVLAHYSPDFLDQMINVVAAATLLAYALYAVSPETVEKFGSADLIFTLPFVLYGIFRYLFLVYHRKSPSSPTDAVVRDLPSLINGVLWTLAVIAVVYRPWER